MVHPALSRHVRRQLLTEKDVAAYLDLEFDEHRFPAELSTWLHTKTGGSPLFLIDVVQYLVKDGAIVERPSWLHGADRPRPPLFQQTGQR